jgi:hypothetical protein
MTEPKKPQIQHLPEQAKRVETGPVQFGSDWPGLFIRGDDALYYAIALEKGLNALENVDLPFNMRYALEELRWYMDSTKA